ncbi:MAG: ABC transporter substrate-binding protein [Phormidesmis sp.]
MPNLPPPYPKTAPLKVWLVSAVLTCAIVGGIGSIIFRLIDKGDPTAVSIDFRQSLQEQTAVIANESTWLSEAACPEKDRGSFEALKAEGMDARASQNYSRAQTKFETALASCAAPEVLIDLNNARIGAADSHVLVVSVPFSGSNPNNAVEMLRGFAQAQFEVNQAGGINGVPLKLLIVDDGDSKEIAREIAIALTEDPTYANVLGIVGHWTSDVSLQVAPIYGSRAALTFITPISTTNELTGYSPWVFRATLNNRSGARALARYMLDAWGEEKAAIFYVGGVTYSEEIRSEFSQVVDPIQGGQIVAQFDMGARDFNANRAVQAAIEAGAEVILLATDNDSLDQAISVIEANNKQLKVLGDLANLYTTTVLSEASDSAVGMVMATPWDIDGNANKTFVQTSKALWKGPVNYVTAMSYNAVRAMIVAMESQPTRLGINRALNDPNFSVIGNAASIPLKFRNGDRQAPVQLIEVIERPGESGNLAKLDFFPILSVPGDL